MFETERLKELPVSPAVEDTAAKKNNNSDLDN